MDRRVLISHLSIMLLGSVVLAGAESDGRSCIVVKLGGSAVTHKAEFETLNAAILGKTARQLKEACARNDIVLVHGCGSFGHFQAHQYGVSKGTDAPEFAWLGFAKTRRSATTLNALVVDALLQEGLAAVHVAPFPSWRKSGGRPLRATATAGIGDVQALMDAGVLPVLHGDSVLDDTNGCGILSGDALLEELCRALRPRLAVFLTDVAGVYDRPPEEEGAVLLQEIQVRSDGGLDIPQIQAQVGVGGASGGGSGGGGGGAVGITSSTAAHDVTGGVAAKLQSAAAIAACGVDVVIVQAGTQHAAEALAGRWPARCTRVFAVSGDGGRTNEEDVSDATLKHNEAATDGVAHLSDDMTSAPYGTTSTPRRWMR